MNNEPLELLDVIRQWRRAPKRAASRAAEDQAALIKLPPQITWTLLGLIH